MRIFWVLFFSTLGNLFAQNPCDLQITEIKLDSNQSTCNYKVIEYTLSGGQAASYYWEYGDGENCTCLHPKHFYTQNGNFDVCAVITDTSGCKDTLCQSVEVNCSNPCDLSEIGIHSVDTLSFTCSEVEFITITSSNARYIKWDFGDGDSSDQKYVVHDFKKNGIYEVELIVNDSISCADTATLQIEIDCPESEDCDFKIISLDTLSLSECSERTFVAKMTDQPIMTIWDFGDGNKGNTDSVQTHSYIQDGMYKVVFSAYLNHDCGDTAEMYVYIECENENSIYNEAKLQSLIYPNPFADYLHIVGSKSGHIKIFNSSLKMMGEFELDSQSLDIQTEHFPTGVYYIILTSEESVYSGRFLKY